MGLLFQPRWSSQEPGREAASVGQELADERAGVVLAALRAVLLGDDRCFADVFTDDVAFRSPHFAAASLTAVRRAMGAPEDALSQVEIVVRRLDIVGDRVIVEWRLEGLFTGPVLFDDRLLIEPTGGAVHLSGVSIAEFRGERIAGFRHYFDDSELLSGVPGAAGQLRWAMDR